MTWTTTVETPTALFGSDVIVAASAVTVNVDVDEEVMEGRVAVELTREEGFRISVGREDDDRSGVLRSDGTRVGEGMGPSRAIDGAGGEGRAVLVNNPVVTNLSLDVSLACTGGTGPTTIDVFGCPGFTAIVDDGRTCVEVPPSAADTKSGITRCRLTNFVLMSLECDGVSGDGAACATSRR